MSRARESSSVDAQVTSSFERRPVVFLMGPTASGKTALATAVAQHFDVDLVSVDSSLVYRGFDIGSAKPDRATLARFPHALIDIREPWQTYSAAEFAHDAAMEIRRIHGAGRVPLLVGGTGLYFRALDRGLSALPTSDPALRKRLSDEAALHGWHALHARLAGLDPAAALRIHRNDAQRIGRALEVIALSGLALSAQQDALATSSRSWRILKLAVATPDRAQLHARIASRLDAMWAAGFLDEVRALMTRPSFDAGSTSMRAVGYRQSLQHLHGEFDFDECRRRALFASRQLAKRQLTWLRSERDSIGVSGASPDDALHRVKEFLP